ncbi:GNAT family N-acetyltransferase [Vibrio sp. T187]|uniref:GNAT family N-acetyltransferase n=1 Tax=Vibrio TaxID=662 RepID=UPI0010C93728|nr:MULTISPECIES: GNAT family N-acetyltransferase [Vibrio]MBW3695276.1 GNAT family N-acetyltransferase [Vibrio sp. T187]
MLEIKKLEATSVLSTLKAEYFSHTTDPLDGMWHFGFAPMAQHFGFYEHDQLVGFCCINSDDYLLQYYLSPHAMTSADELFALIAQDNSNVIGTINGAFVSTCDPKFLSMCLDNSTSIKVNALMYCGIHKAASKPANISLTEAFEDQIHTFVEFAAHAIGAPKEWLTSYFGNLIARRELFGYWEKGQLVASGECRKFDEHQTEFADLGMIVSPDYRGQGVATEVLRALILLASSQGLTPMCSTEKTNIPAQKAIAKADLLTHHRLLQVEFK